MSILQFDGTKDYIEIPDDAGFSVATTGTLTIAASMRPDVLTFPHFERSGYVHWMGKGEIGRQEWTFRMYNETTTDNPPRPNRISFYVFDLQGGKGVGSYFQEPVQAGEWIHVIGIADGQNTSIYKNGVFKKSESYSGIITPQHGAAPLRIGTRDFKSFFLGAIRGVRVWNRALTPSEVQMVAGDSIPQDGLVAEYRLDQDVALDTTEFHNGRIVGGSWQTTQTQTREPTRGGSGAKC
jgi:concanavalin A-like lectin/glucanase superfamily protein